MKLPWTRQHDRKVKKQQIASISTVPTAQKTFRDVLGIPSRRLKKLFGKTKHDVRKPQNQAPMKDLKTADSLPTSSIDGMPSLVETGALNVAHDSPPVAVDAGIPEGSGLENNPSIEEQESRYGDISTCADEADRSSLETVIVRPRRGVVFSEALSTTSVSEGHSLWFYHARPHRAGAAFVTESLDPLEFLDVPVFFDSTTDVVPIKEESGRPTALRHEEATAQHSELIAAESISRLEHHPNHRDRAGSSSEEVQEEELEQSTCLDDNIAGQDYSPYIPRLRSSFRPANLSSPMNLFAKNFEDIEGLLHCDRPFRSVGPWRVATPFPNVLLGHVRALSGDTAVDHVGFQGESQTSQRQILSHEGLQPTQDQAQDRSENDPIEDTEGSGSLIGINVISSDVQWETVLESRQISHENEMADLVEDHAAEMEELRAKNTNQVRRLEHKLAHVLSVNKQLQEQTAELCKQNDFQAEQVQSKDEVLQQVVANHQGLQLRYEELQQRLARQGSAEALTESILPAHNNAVFEQVTELESIVRRQDHVIDFLYKRNNGLTAALAKDKAESDFNLARVYQLTYVLEDKPPSDPEKDRLLEYKDKMYKDLDTRCSDIITALETTVQTMEKQAELDKTRNTEEITTLHHELEKKSRLNSDLQARKDAFRTTNKLMFDMRKRSTDDTGFQKALNEIFEVVQQDNLYLEAAVEDRTKDVSDARIEIASLKSTIRDFDAAEGDKDRTIATLEARKRALECDLGRLQIEAEILPTEYNEALAEKDALISHYQHQAEISIQEKNSFINARLDFWVRRSLQSKDNEIYQLQRRVEEIHTHNLGFRYRMDKMMDIRAQDADYAYADGVESQLNKDRTKAAEEEAAKLRKELSDLREYHNPIRNKEDKDIEEVLQESEELQKHHVKIEAELQTKVNYLSTRLDQGTTWAHAVKDLGGNLLARMSRLENILKVYGIRNDDDQRDTLIARYNSLLGFIEDDETGAEEEAKTTVPEVRQIMADFHEILAESGPEHSQATSAGEPSPADRKPKGLSAVAAGKLPETPNTRAQRIIAEKERARGILFDSNGRVKSRVHTVLPKQEVVLGNSSVQDEGDSFEMTSSAWARRYSPTDEAGSSNAQDMSFF